MRCAPGGFAVEMVPRPEKVGALYVPDVLKNNVRLDMGKVIASNCPLKVGDIVLLKHNRGMCVTGFGWDTKIARSEVRFYGSNGGPGSRAPLERINYDDCAMAVMEETIKPTGSNVLLKMGKRQNEKGGIQLIHGSRDPVCTIVAVGGGVSMTLEDGRPAYDVNPGEKWVVNQNALWTIEGMEEDLALCDIDGLLVAWNN